MGEIKPFGVALGLLGNLMVGFAMHKLLLAVSCTANLQSLGGCTNDITGSVPILIIGIFIVTAAVFAGGSSIAFLGLFFAIGAGALIASFQAHDSFIPSFGKLFGGIFVGVSTLMAILFGGLSSWGRGRKQTATDMQALFATRAATAMPMIPTVVTPPAAAPAADSVAELEKLGAMHASGALTDAEFAAAKAKILGTA